MATWVRQNSNQLQVGGGSLTGTLDLDNATAPGDFDPAAVTSVRFELGITGANYGDDSWTNLKRAALCASADNELAAVDLADQASLKNVTNSIDSTDSTGIPTTYSTAQWEAAVVFALAIGGATAFATFQQNMAKDTGVTTTIPVAALTVTITYTPGAAPPNEGTASGTIAWAGAATGAVGHAGASTGTVTWAGTATGAVTHEGAATGTVTWAGTADGVAPSGANEGSASGSISWAGTADGTSTHEGSATGSITWSGTSDGTAVYEGSATGSVTWAGSADGETTHEGAATGSITWAGSATGVAGGGGGGDPFQTIRVRQVSYVGVW